jgi:signal transduction histidine kinase
VDLLIIALLVGIFATNALTRWFIYPVKELGYAMERISEGDFSVRLKTKTSSKEIKEIFSGFNMMAKELQSTEILQSDFVSNVSHEFKTPINAIEGYSMLLQDGENLTNEQKEYVDKIVFNTHRLSSLTGSILLLSKLENQSIVSKKTSFDLDEQIRKSLLALEGQWASKEIEFDIEMDDTDYVGNEALLHHIWDNLISNAIKFSDNGTEIKIRLENHADKIVFTISDQGIGIDEETQKHLFDKFYQGDSSRKNEGNGLGLALVKKIIDLEGGEITVKNNEDRGCTFTVVLNR